MITPDSGRSRGGGLTGWLERAPAPLFVVFAIFAAFTTYFCMYAFRKPFAAAKFEGIQFLGTSIGLKTAVVISQILGYACSKYIGIKVCSEVTARRRAWTLAGLVVAAEVALVAYGFLPGGWKVVAIFFNGLPLGMVWGLVVWYLEGRRTSDVLLAGLCCAFIVSSGIVKDIGRAMMGGGVAESWHHVPVIGPSIGNALGAVSESWMPAMVGLHFLPLFFLSVWLLSQLPRPNAADIAARVEREPMTGADRVAFVRQFFLGMSLLCLAYLLLTAYRDFRDNYQVELFDQLGYPYAQNKSIISKTETLVAFGVIGAMALLNVVRDNRKGLMLAFAMMFAGCALLGIGTLLKDFGVISGFWWMALTGIGSYLTYVPYNSVLFDRIIASTRVVGTAVFAIYLADAIGYTGSVAVQLYKDLAQSSVSRLGFFRSYTYFMSVLGMVCLACSAVYFARRTKPSPESSGTRP